MNDGNPQFDLEERTARFGEETKHWLRMIARAEPTRKEPARPLWKEAQELRLIFSAIIRRRRGE
jgi:hypothetical protein